MSQAPAYQMYAGDWLKSRSVRLMVDYQRGWYIQLLNEAWDGTPQCMLPNNTELLQILAGVSEHSRSHPEFNDRWTAVERMFKVDGEYVYNERQLEELVEQQRRRDISIRAGHASAKKREEKRKELQRLKAEHLAASNGRSTGVEFTFNGNPTLLPSTSTPSPASLEDPPNPPPAGECEAPKRKRKKRLKVAEKKRLKVEQNTIEMARIGSWFGRKAGTLWNLYESEAIEQLSPIPEDDISIMERYYTAGRVGDKDCRRHNVETLLNNWPGELDRAARYDKTKTVAEPRRQGDCW